MYFDELETSVYNLMKSLTVKEKFELAERLKAIIDGELLKCEIPSDEYVCPVCGGKDFIQYGKTLKGTQRWKCKCCGKVRTHEKIGNVLSKTKLSYDKWAKFIPLFIDHVSCDRVARELKVCHKTAWFMRIRLLEAVYKELPAFQTKADNHIQIDEMYFRESFKGTDFTSMEHQPRQPRTGEEKHRVSGISNDQICVLTAVNDNHDFHFDVVCRGALTVDVAESSLKGRISAGSIVNTDKHRSYPKVLANLGASIHNIFSAKEHTGLDSINHVHSHIRAFMRGFYGVSTRWLHLYLGWFKWIGCFYSDKLVAARQLGIGDYEHTWRSILKMGNPFRNDSFDTVKA